MSELFDRLSQIAERPRPFEHYTTLEMWSDEHISRHMLEAHLDRESDLASRNAAFIHRSVEWIRERFAISSQTRIADFGCGPGLYTTALASAGARVFGIDASRRSIEHAVKVAQERGLAVEYVVGDYLESDLPGGYDLIMMIYCDFCVLDPQQRTRLLGKWRTLLAPGGRLLFDVASVPYFDSISAAHSYKKASRGGFWSAAPYVVFDDTFRWEETKLLLERHTVIEADRTRVFYNWLQCFSREAVARELEAAGFAVEACYANVAGDPPDEAARELAVVAAHAR